MDKLNKTQERIYAYLLERAQASVVPPTVREIGTAVGLKSTSSVQGNLDALVGLRFFREILRALRALRSGLSRFDLIG